VSVAHQNRTQSTYTMVYMLGEIDPGVYGNGDIEEKETLPEFVSTSETVRVAYRFPKKDL
jgi:hypothetical protein